MTTFNYKLDFNEHYLSIRKVQTTNAESLFFMQQMNNLLFYIY